MSVIVPTRVRRSYSTTFTNAENPLRESGAWRHLDSTLTEVRSENIGGTQVAHGTQVGADTYDDSNAYLYGFSPNQWIQGIVWRKASITGTGNREIELLLRWSDWHPAISTAYGPTSVEGYEINVQHDGNYLQLGRFKGENLYDQPLGATPVTGDVFYAEIQTLGNGSVQIVAKWNGVVKINVNDPTPWLVGNPGVGFFISSGTQALNNEFGFSSITAGEF